MNGSMVASIVSVGLVQLEGEVGRMSGSEHSSSIETDMKFLWK